MEREHVVVVSLEALSIVRFLIALCATSGRFQIEVDEKGVSLDAAHRIMNLILELHETVHPEKNARSGNLEIPLKDTWFDHLSRERRPSGRSIAELMRTHGFDPKIVCDKNIEWLSQFWGRNIRLEAVLETDNRSTLIQTNVVQQAIDPNYQPAQSELFHSTGTILRALLLGSAE